jgi:hypothetical protein
MSALYKMIGSNCKSSGNCEPGPFTEQGKIKDAGANTPIVDLTVSVTLDRDYPTGIHEELVAALTAGVDKVKKCTTSQEENCTKRKRFNIPNIHTCGRKLSHIKKSILGADMSFLFSLALQSLTSCTVPAYWAINYQTPSAANAAPPCIEVTLSAHEDTNGFCSTFKNVESAVAGKFLSSYALQNNLG